MSAFSLLIEKYTAQKECVLSYPVNLKPKALQPLLGCFVNMGLIKLSINSNNTVKEFIEHVTQQRAISKRHQKIPLFDIVSRLRRTNNYEENALNVSIAETTLGLVPLQLEHCECQTYPRELQHIEDLGCHVYTYEEINQRANQLANLIRRLYQHNQNDSLHADTLVGICVPRSLNMIIGILGILKAGAAYVPLDPEYPEERLKYILEDCQPLLIITEEDIVAKYAFISKLYSNKLLVLDDIK